MKDHAKLLVADGLEVIHDIAPAVGPWSVINASLMRSYGILCGSVSQLVLDLQRCGGARLWTSELCCYGCSIHALSIYYMELFNLRYD